MLRRLYKYYSTMICVKIYSCGLDTRLPEIRQAVAVSFIRDRSDIFVCFSGEWSFPQKEEEIAILIKFLATAFVDK